MNPQVLAVLEKARLDERFAPPTVQAASDGLLSMLEDLELQARRVERMVDDLEVDVTAGMVDAAEFGKVAVLKSKAGALRREANALREPLVRLRRNAVEFRAAERQVRASFKRAGLDVPADDLTQDEIDRAPQLDRGGV